MIRKITTKHIALGGNKRLVIIIVLLFFIFVHSNFGHTTFSDWFSCGLDPEVKRVLSGWKKPEFPMKLAGVSKQGMSSVVILGISYLDENEKYSEKAFISTDHGNTWQLDVDESPDFTSLALVNSTFTGIRDSQNRKVLWVREDKTKLALSQDGGNNWKSLTPLFDNYKNIESIHFLIPGMRDAGRLYASVVLKNDDMPYMISRSDDYGETFFMVSSKVNYFVESRATDEIYIGLSGYDKDLNRSIIVSNDRGRNWRETQSKTILEQLVGIYGGDLKTWIDTPDDERFVNPRFVIQIDSDPIDANIFYVVTWKGVYATRDQGATYRLLPLAIEDIHGVDSIAVDPIDGRYIYAVVRSSELYRSSDKGCTWTKLKLPKP